MATAGVGRPKRDQVRICTPESLGWESPSAPPRRVPGGVERAARSKARFPGVSPLGVPPGSGAHDPEVQILLPEVDDPRVVKENPSFAADIQEVFTRTGCASSGCRGAGPQAGLDLRPGSAYAAFVG